VDLLGAERVGDARRRLVPADRGQAGGGTIPVDLVEDGRLDRILRARIRRRKGVGERPVEMRLDDRELGLGERAVSAGGAPGGEDDREGDDDGSERRAC